MVYHFIEDLVTEGLYVIVRATVFTRYVVLNLSFFNLQYC